MTRFGNNCRPIQPKVEYLFSPGAAQYVNDLKAERDRYRKALETLLQSARNIHESNQHVSAEYYSICPEFVISTIESILAGKEVKR